MKKLTAILTALLMATPALSAPVDLTITVDSSQASRILNAFDYKACVGEEMPGVDGCTNLTAKRYMQQELLEYIKNRTLRYERRNAAISAELGVVEVPLTETE